MLGLRTEIYQVADLKPMPKNTKKHPKWQIEKIIQSISKYSKDEPKLLQPIVVDEKKMIIIGHGRLEAIKELKWDTVECVIKDGLSEDEKVALSILDNKSTSLEYDEDLLAKVLPELSKKAIETGFSEREIAELVEKSTRVPEEEITPAYDMSPRLYESYNYILLFFKNDIDFLYASQLFDLKKMSDRMKPKKVGLYRAVDGIQAIKKIKEKGIHEISNPVKAEARESTKSS